jgi:hypothetical protein
MPTKSQSECFVSDSCDADDHVGVVCHRGASGSTDRFHTIVSGNIRAGDPGQDSSGRIAGIMIESDCAA